MPEGTGGRCSCSEMCKEVLRGHTRELALVSGAMGATEGFICISES